MALIGGMQGRDLSLKPGPSVGPQGGLMSRGSRHPPYPYIPQVLMGCRGDALNKVKAYFRLKRLYATVWVLVALLFISVVVGTVFTHRLLTLPVQASGFSTTL